MTTAGGTGFGAGGLRAAELSGGSGTRGLGGRWRAPAEHWQKTREERLFSGPLDGGGRRAIDQQMSIMQPPEFPVGFNLPDLKFPSGRRDVTNVPAQALILLNDPFVKAMADTWAERLVDDSRSRPEQRIEAIFPAAFGRSPTAAKRACRQAADFVAASLTDRPTSSAMR